MSEYLGPLQTRVLDSTNRNFDMVVYQKRKPPLSCEEVLTGVIASDKARDIQKYLGPSGWNVVGSIKDNFPLSAPVSEASCIAGDVLCSPTYARNTFKLISLDKGQDKGSLYAMVNGWKVLVNLSNSFDLNNIIELEDPPSIDSRIDFVFLEVWKKLITTSDTIYRYGNVGNTDSSNFSNDLIDPFIGIETSLRVQIQYQIRVVSGIDIQTYPDGFDPIVKALGPLSSVSSYSFSQVPGDIGLWRAGYGESTATTESPLETTDGYIYAIPMFAISRRKTDPFNFNVDSNGAGKTLANYVSGKASDRPDDQYNDWIVSDQILDLRHRISPVENLKEICNEGFQNLITGKSRGVMGYSVLGEDHYGPVLMQADSINPLLVDLAGTTTIGYGDGTRRVFSNAEINQSDVIYTKTVNDKFAGTTGAVWAGGDTVRLEVPAGYPAGTVIISVEAGYNNLGNLLIDSLDFSVTNLSTSIVTITIEGAGVVLPGTLNPAIFSVTYRIPSGQHGFSFVPELMYEYRTTEPDSTLNYALRDQDVRVRAADPVVSVLDGTNYNMMSNKIWHNHEPWNFGQQMIYHVQGSGTNTVTVPRSPYGYTILGVASVGYGNPKTYINPSVTRDAVSYYITHTSSIPDGVDVEIVLYVGEKFFDTNKQSRAISETYEMKNYTWTATGSSSYLLDTSGFSIIAMASNRFLDSTGYVYIDGVQTALVNSNKDLPNLPYLSNSITTLNFTSAPDAGSAVEIPLVIKSAVTASEGYVFFYKTVPYQGLLDTTAGSHAVGSVIAEGPAVTTTAGSGGVSYYKYQTGTATFVLDSSVVNGTGTQWLSNVKAGDIIYGNADPTTSYVISSVYNDNVLYLTESVTLSGATAYTIEDRNSCSFEARNIIDRLPAKDTDCDSSGHNGLISIASSDRHQVLETRIISRVQDVLGHQEITIGSGTAERGRSIVHVTDNGRGLGNLGLKFEKTDSTAYQKTYQSYIFDKDNSGKLCMMVVGSETGNDASSRSFVEYNNNDTVDIFELPGRPITGRRLV